MQLALARPLLTVSPWIPSLLVKLRRQLPPSASGGYSQCPGEPSTVCLRGTNTFCSRHRCFLQACPHSPLARIQHQQKSFPQVPPPLNRPTIPFSSLPLVTIPTGASASARKARSAWIALDILPSLSNPLMSLTKPAPTPGPITPRTPPPARSSSST